MRRKSSKAEWRNAIGGFEKPRRLHLRKNRDGIVICPVETCDHAGFLTERGCRKHVFNSHGWYYFYDVKPDENFCFPQGSISNGRTYVLNSRAKTSAMPSFEKECNFAKDFFKWLTGDSGGAKSTLQANQIVARVLKYLKFCLSDAETDFNVPNTAVDYNISCTKVLSDFMDSLRLEWKLGYSGVIGYVNAIEHAIDFRQSVGGFIHCRDVLNIVEIYMSRTKKALARKMRLEWNKMLDIDFLDKQGCWASFEDLQKVVPFHEKRFVDIISKASNKENFITSRDLSFCTHFIAGLMFLDVKASRPMTYQHLTVTMVQSIGGEKGTIDQTMFKTMEQYGFDSLVIEENQLRAIRLYINHIRARLTPACDYLLITRTGKQLTQLSGILGNFVYEAIGKYVHPTRLRQIIETESAKTLTIEQQALISEDQKHSSHVAKVYYKKLRSRDVAFKAKAALATLTKCSNGVSSILPCLKNVEATGNGGEISSVSEDQIVNAQVKVEDDETTTRAKKTFFTKTEDAYLINGIKKHGWGNWSSILRDKHYKFDDKRTSQTLHRRATLRKMNKL